jgi:hypothetical protein
VHDSGETCIAGTSAEIQSEFAQAPPPAGGGTVAPTPRNASRFRQSTLCRRHSRVWFCRRGAAFDISAHKTFVGKIFRGGKPLCAVFTVDQGRRVYEGSRSLEVRKVETTAGVYLCTPRAPASPDAQ